VVGSSAGGSTHSRRWSASCRTTSGRRSFLAQHIDPERESHLGEILARRSTLPVVEVTGGESLAPGTVYVVPADRHVEIVDGAIRLSATGEDHVSTPSIDLLLTSAAASYGEDLVAVILSGSGATARWVRAR
jgi:two-component system CheB/CheR fusion protein